MIFYIRSHLPALPAQLLELQLSLGCQQLVPACRNRGLLDLQLLQPVLCKVLRHKQLHLLGQKLFAILTAAAVGGGCSRLLSLQTILARPLLEGAAGGAAIRLMLRAGPSAGAAVSVGCSKRGAVAWGGPRRRAVGRLGRCCGGPG